MDEILKGRACVFSSQSVLISCEPALTTEEKATLEAKGIRVVLD